MPVLITDDLHLDIPTWVTNQAAFRRWTEEPTFPETGNIWWLRGQVWADMSMEQIFSHGDVKGEIFFVLKGIVKQLDLGRIFKDGVLFSKEEAGVSGCPDALFFAHETRADGRITLVEGRTDGYVEIQGSPDMVLEVVSDSSVDKDKNILREDYFAAGVREYWLVDARQEPSQFDILHQNSRGFVASRKTAGWVKSKVFGRSFRLLVEKDRSGDPRFVLESK